MQFIKKGTTQTKATLLLQSFLTEGGYLNNIDGKFGNGTELAVKKFQRENKLVSDGIVGEKTWTKLYSLFPDLVKRITAKYLSEEDIEQIADQLSIEVAVIKAVNEVESSGSGFIIDQPKILFEGHIFWKQLKKNNIDPREYSRQNPSIIYKKWTKSHYLGGLKEYQRLAIAKEIHTQSALESTSWGAFQVMGFNAQDIGYASVNAFVDEMYLHERNHLQAMMKFVETNHLLNALRERDWATFARGYNGSGYRKNRYDTKLKKAYTRHK